MSQPLLRLQNIEKSFDGTLVLRGICLDVGEGEFITLLGPSGCGKTTTLRIIAGLETPEKGSVLLDGVDVTATPPEKRSVNTVFQSYALFPHMTVARNIGYSLRVKGMPRDAIAARVEEMLRLVQLEGFGPRRPDQLSGGQRQRVAIARAVAGLPRILLLDEPLGALDLQLRRQMQGELKNLQKTLGITFIYITHDQEEALNMSSRIAVMNEGRFEQIGTPEDIYERPKTRFAASFIGQSNILEGRVAASSGQTHTVELPGGSFPALGEAAVGENVAVCVRAERIDYAERAPEGFSLPGAVLHHSYIGGVLRTTLRLQGGQELMVTGANPTARFPDGCPIQVFWDPQTAAIVERSAPHAQ